MAAEGIEFKTGFDIGKEVPAKQLLDENDAVCLCMGSTWPRDLPIPGKKMSIKGRYYIALLSMAVYFVFPNQ